jgi:vacuolar-type H+-ATPase subunit I/STV1
MSDLPEPVQEYIRSVRAEAKKDRTTQQENAAQKARDEQLQKVAVALGLADEKPTEETLNETISGLTTDLAAAQERVAQFERRDAITTAADAVKVNAQAALALKDTDAALADVDLNDSKAVQDALLKVADQHPHIKVASTVDQSGGDFQNGSGRKPSDPKDLHAAVGSYYQ